MLAAWAAYNGALPPAETPMKPFGTPYSDHALRVLLLGSGELGKEARLALTFERMGRAKRRRGGK